MWFYGGILRASPGFSVFLENLGFGDWLYGCNGGEMMYVDIVFGA